MRFVATAYRVQTRVNAVLSDRARRRGWTTAALGYPGYAARGRARVRGRLLLAPAGTDPNARARRPWLAAPAHPGTTARRDRRQPGHHAGAYTCRRGWPDRPHRPRRAAPGADRARSCTSTAARRCRHRCTSPHPMRPEGSSATSTTRSGSPESGIPSELRGAPSPATAPPAARWTAWRRCSAASSRIPHTHPSST